MTTSSDKHVITAVLDRFGQTFAEELNIRLEKNTPSPLFRLLVFALLASARIDHRKALAAARALTEQGWNTAEKMAAASWHDRTDTLNRSGYARYDESTSRMLGETSEHLVAHYRGDLRKLREQAGRNPTVERKLLKECKGIGNVGVDIFFREIQYLWEELYPFADRRVLKAASRLGLGDCAEDLLRRADNPADFARLAAALVRMELTSAYHDMGCPTV